MRHRPRWAHTPVIHAASHSDMKKELHGFLFSTHARDSSFCIAMGLRLRELCYKFVVLLGLVLFQRVLHQPSYSVFLDPQ